MVLSSGDVLGAYTIQSLLGAGGMGEVYRAHDARLERFVAIKILRHGVDEEAARARFFREARTVAKLGHPNVISLFDVGENDGLPFLVMELVEGPSLAVLIAERRDLTLETKLRYVIDICDGLSHAHARGIVHRDVKPSNVLIDDGRARLADFGIALDTQSTVTSIGGSPNYFAPEQFAGAADHRADLFSLGALFYELLTGVRAFPGSIADGLLHRIAHAPAPELPAHFDGTGLAGLVARALEKDPDKRFQSAAEFKLAIAQASAGAAFVAGTAAAPIHEPARDTDVGRLRRRLIESVAPSEIKRLKYEVDEYLARQPYDVDGRMLSDDIERALGIPGDTVLVPRAAGTTRSSWKRPAAYASTIAIAVIAVSTLVMMRDPALSPAADTVAGRAAPVMATSPRAASQTPPSAPSRVVTAPPETASERQRISRSLSTTDPTPPPQSLRPTDSPDLDTVAIHALITQYETADARQDIEAVKGVYPGVDAQALAAAYAQYKVLQHALSIRSIRMSGTTEAIVDADIELTSRTNTGQTISDRSSVTIRLRKLASTWRIEGIDAMPASR